MTNTPDTNQGASARSVKPTAQGKQVVTRVEHLKELDGTYEITLVEQSRRKLTTKDELISIIAQLASEAQRAVDMGGKILGEKDVFLAFARRFIHYLEDTEDDLFSDFLKDKGKLSALMVKARLEGERKYYGK